MSEDVQQKSVPLSGFNRAQANSDRAPAHLQMIWPTIQVMNAPIAQSCCSGLNAVSAD